MGLYICKLCGNEERSNNIPEKCSQCGQKSKEWEKQKPPILKLSFDSKEIVIYTEKKAIGKDNLRIFGHENAKYISDEQFILNYGNKGWEILGVEGVVNSTRLNNIDIKNKSMNISNMDKISVGTLTLEVKIEKK